MEQITDLLKSAERNIQRGALWEARSDLNIALVFAKVYLNPHSIKHRLLRAHVATAIEALKERRSAFLYE